MCCKVLSIYINCHPQSTRWIHSNSKLKGFLWFDRPKLTVNSGVKRVNIPTVICVHLFTIQRRIYETVKGSITHQSLSWSCIVPGLSLAEVMDNTDCTTEL